MPNITRWASNGLHSIQVGARGSTGHFAGFAGLEAADTGESSGMRLLIGAVSAPSPLPGVNRVYNRGEDGYVSSFLHSAQPNDFTIGFEAIDGDLSAFLNQDTVLTEGQWDFIAEGGSVDFRDVMWLFSRHAQSKESDSDNAPGYENLLVMSSNGRLEPGSMDFQAAGAANIQAVASPVQKTHKGTTTLASFGKASIYTERFFSEYPVTMVCFVGDGTEDEISLPFTPISTVKSKAYLWSDGSALTVSAVNTSTDTATLSAAPASGAIVIVVFETTDI